MADASSNPLANDASGTSVAWAAKMAFDGFESEQRNAFIGFSSSTSASFFAAVDWAAKRWRVEVVGVEHVPRGRALLVGNHAFGFWDLALAIARVRAETGRRVWVLGEHLWWRVPFVRKIASAIGIVDGTRENADALLAAEELVLVLPGGLREAMKPRELRYRLLWGRRYGFVRTAVRNGAPIVPLACVGGDDLFDLVGDAFARGRRLKLKIPIPRPSYALPVPHPAPIRVVIGEPIDAAARTTGREDEASLRSVRREVEGALHEMIEVELARRADFPYA